MDGILLYHYLLLLFCFGVLRACKGRGKEGWSSRKCYVFACMVQGFFCLGSLLAGALLGGKRRMDGGLN